MHTHTPLHLPAQIQNWWEPTWTDEELCCHHVMANCQRGQLSQKHRPSRITTAIAESERQDGSEKGC